MQDQSDRSGSQPQNEIERMLLAAEAGSIPLDDFLRHLIVGDLFVPSRTEVVEDGSGLMPLLFDRDGVLMTTVCTTFDRTTMYKDDAPFVLLVNGRELFARLPDGYGIVLNPKHQIGMEILPHGVKEIVRDLT